MQADKFSRCRQPTDSHTVSYQKPFGKQKQSIPALMVFGL